jgi:MFS superfamily sulfate permease-like transporter
MANLDQGSIFFNALFLFIAGIALVSLVYLIGWFLLNRESWPKIFVNPREVSSQRKGTFVLLLAALFVVVISLSVFGS